MEDQNKNKKQGSGLESLRLASQLGYTMVIPILLGAFAGRWIDGKLDTDVVFTIILILLGIATGLTGAYKLVMAVTKKKK